MFLENKVFFNAVLEFKKWSDIVNSYKRHTLIEVFQQNYHFGHVMSSQLTLLKSAEYDHLLFGYRLIS